MPGCPSTAKTFQAFSRETAYQKNSLLWFTERFRVFKLLYNAGGGMICNPTPENYATVNKGSMEQSNPSCPFSIATQQICHYGVLWIHPRQWSVEEQTEHSSWKRTMQVLWVNLALWMPLSVILYIFIKRHAGRVSAAHPLFKMTKVRLLSNIQHLVPFSACHHHPC